MRIVGEYIKKLQVGLINFLSRRKSKMTVAELIEKLKEMPQDFDVSYFDGEGLSICQRTITSVELQEGENVIVWGDFSNEPH